MFPCGLAVGNPVVNPVQDVDAGPIGRDLCPMGLPWSLAFLACPPLSTSFLMPPSCSRFRSFAPGPPILWLDCLYPWSHAVCWRVTIASSSIVSSIHLSSLAPGSPHCSDIPPLQQVLACSFTTRDLGPRHMSGHKCGRSSAYPTTDPQSQDLQTLVAWVADFVGVSAKARGGRLNPHAGFRTSGGNNRLPPSPPASKRLLHTADVARLFFG